MSPLGPPPLDPPLLETVVASGRISTFPGKENCNFIREGGTTNIIERHGMVSVQTFVNTRSGISEVLEHL